jgi:hypothetical protein
MLLTAVDDWSACNVRCLYLPVVQESRSCVVSVTADPQYISSLSSTFNGGSVRGSVPRCGSKSTPWRLEAPLGQRINISLLDFASHQQQHDKDITRCRQYGTIIDKNNKNNVSICAGVTEDVLSSQRHSHVYVSQSNVVAVLLTGSETTDADQHNFLVKVNGSYVVSCGCNCFYQRFFELVLPAITCEM